MPLFIHLVGSVGLDSVLIAAGKVTLRAPIIARSATQRRSN
jgi:hypothetical protein